MCLHINRFAFDFVNMKREKLDDRMEFPMVLNMNHYLHGYEAIPNKITEDTNPTYFLQQVHKPSPFVKKPPPKKNPFPPIP
jgi:hypothetical protein